VRLCSVSRLMGRWLLGSLATGALLPACLAYVPSTAQAQQSCEIEKAQQLFGQQPRPTAEIERLLAACQAAGSTDYRVTMFLGVMARDGGDREQAIAYLREAHEMAPQEPNPALELGFTLEAKHAREARKVYEQILAHDPASRPAALGLARVARSQNRLDEARSLYQRLLAVNPRDPDALNGMAWLALANRERAEALTGFGHVLTIDPDNEEAKTGLSNAPDVYRYLLDVGTTVVSTADGTSWGFGARGTAGISPFDTLELGWSHFSQELERVSASGLTILPSQDITLGYHRLVPLSYAVSLVYDYRTHDNLPTEHWIEGSLDIYATDWLRWFGAYREAFGGFLYDGSLIRTGLAATVAPNWEVTGTIYKSAQVAFNNNEDLWTGMVEAIYYGPHNLLVVAGGGYSPQNDNLNLHALAVVPITDRIALQLIAARYSVNADTRATAGFLYTW
jgi:hypothetical protein